REAAHAAVPEAGEARSGGRGWGGWGPAGGSWGGGGGGGGGRGGRRGGRGGAAPALRGAGLVHQSTEKAPLARFHGAELREESVDAEARGVPAGDADDQRLREAVGQAAPEVPCQEGV